MTAPAQHQTSASSRTALRKDLRTLIGRDVTEVRITPARWGDGTVWCVAAFVAADGRQGRREIPLPKGAHRPIVALIREAFPSAAWSVAQDYHVTSGILREHLVRMPACLRGDDL